MQFFDVFALVKIIKIIAYFTSTSLNSILNFKFSSYIYIKFFSTLLNLLSFLIICTK